MPAADIWVGFLLKHPEFFELSKSTFFISLLEFMSAEAKSFDAVLHRFPRVERRDMLLVLGALIKLGAIEKVALGHKSFYLTTPKGKEMLALYKKTKRFFDM